MAHERYAKQGHAEQVEQFGACVVDGGGAPNGGEHHGYQCHEVDNHTHIEGHAEVVGKEPLEPAAYLYNAWHNAVKHCSHQQHRHDEGYQ